eukprot:maker-scaffold252_size238019-snap-gene-1.40 protein:Tk06201 transcript:maker-scaffold252_size238019-snap-gene-1.40-mRNA-1 annotation:"hypothetical protein TcasGA2_TC003271"
MGYLVAIVMLLGFICQRTTGEPLTREGKLFSMFNIVKFANDPCIGTSQNGTCYSPNECTAKGGRSSGTCAQGYGVCCTFAIACNGQSAENSTYLESGTITPGLCTARICPQSQDICQFRLDFDNFVLTGPSSNTESEYNLAFGQVPPRVPTSNNEVATSRSQCLTDHFSVSNPGSASPPTICGVNTGEHMYVDAPNKCIDLHILIGAAGIFAEIPPNRKWSIQVNQYSCDDPNLAPTGCTQYFFDPSGTRVVQTYNYNNGNGQHLANQKQTVCVRREKGFCQICWMALADDDFQVSGEETKGITNPSSCCNYGDDGNKGFDCVSIPGAMLDKPGSRICGRSKGLVSVDDGPSTSVCSQRTPFMIRFISDGYEYGDGKEGEREVGFKLQYVQKSNEC